MSRAEILNFFTKSNLSFFSSMVSILEPSLRIHAHMKASQIFSSDVAFKFRSIVHNKTILYGVRIQSRFIFFPHMDIKLLQYHLLEGASFPSGITLEFSSHFNWPYMCESTSRCYILLNYLFV